MVSSLSISNLKFIEIFGVSNSCLYANCNSWENVIVKYLNEMRSGIFDLDKSKSPSINREPKGQE